MKKSLHIALLCGSLLTLTTSKAQFRDFLFGHFKEKKSITYGLNNRRTKLFQDRATIYGAYAGIQFGNDLKHVLTINSTLWWVGNDADHFSAPSEVQLNFLGFSEEYVFWKKNRWSFSTYIHLGLGKARARATDFNLQTTPYLSRWVFPAEGGIHGEFTLNKWLSFRGGLGYRYVLNSSDWPLHGMYFKVGAGVKIKELLIQLDQFMKVSHKFFRISGKSKKF